MQPTLHQLKVFETAARHGSFTRAAEELYLTQPTVSIQIKQLSKTVGFPLFEKLGKQLYLTEVGNRLFTTCQSIFEELDQFEMIVSDLQGMTQGKLHLATVTTCKYFVPRLLGNFCDQYPGIDISLKITNHLQLEKRMMENRDDLYILSHPPQHIDLKVQPVIKNPLVVVAPPSHPLVGQKNIDISALNNQRFIMREPGSGTRHAVQALFNKHKVNVEIKLELGSNEAIKQAIAGGLGISVLSRHSLNGREYTDLAILDVEHFPIEQQWSVAYLSGKHLSVVAETFLHYLVSVTDHAEMPWMHFK
ncbi:MULTISPECIES: LysR family transcriptional regulator [Acaryochloris]|uniref:Rubisco operon transcriptional regulator RbcR n=1 Tax=Acaryochloris marina (strain MBIC 11017) TaxID=329726 RepID=B0CC64_ACAM1|nr:MULTISPECIES: LysR family transcriptional regulator [Acaryochloris]ABW25606.1 rubisco operon transcriptional regulator RbcR [Acaryochloris marina MBIC11017]KAI9130662.1 LysR family transcriptional regulator [Acaryochloris sp. CCMEE 5410]BDM80484.1 transcriptional regulator [Acaryochloris marina MBIC10699]